MAKSGYLLIMWTPSQTMKTNMSRAGDINSIFPFKPYLYKYPVPPITHKNKLILTP